MSATEAVVDVGPVAHGGHCVARLDGQVVFVRHALPGERVRIRVTERSKTFLRADVLEVLRASPDRVPPPCRYAGDCGGCDFQHVTPQGQRDLKTAVVREQLQRLAHLDVDVVVEAATPDDLGWRTRVSYAVGPTGHLGLRRHRSHDVVEVDRCLIASDPAQDLLAHTWAAEGVELIDSSAGDRLVVVDGRRGSLPVVDATGVVTRDGRVLHGRGSVTETVHDVPFRVSGSGFWQVHPDSARTLADAVMAGLQPQPGDVVADLYAGVGLFTAFLAEAVGDGGVVHSVESDPGGSRDARRNLHALRQVQLVGRTVEKALSDGALGDQLDLVVLDPPRTGAKKAVAPIAALSPRRVVYVACDPAALARDLATFAEHGYALVGLRAFDLFPMTHHVECVAVLEPTA